MKRLSAVCGWLDRKKKVSEDSVVRLARRCCSGSHCAAPAAVANRANFGDLLRKF